MKTSATIISDTMGAAGARITTFEVVAPRYLLAEVNTHRMIARSAASSRAIPVNKRIQMVEDAPYVPAAFGRNEPGMKATKLIDAAESLEVEMLWREGAKQMVRLAKQMATRNVHKQQANRILEPFAYYAGVMTGTEWAWFFELRDHEDADPGFQELAAAMQEAYQSSNPDRWDHHLPYVQLQDRLDLCGRFGAGWVAEAGFHVSAARCARVSYRTFDGKVSSVDDDMGLCQKLIVQKHLSPFDHPAKADKPRQWPGQSAWHWSNPSEHRQFWGWVPYRVDVEAEIGVVPRRDSFTEIPSYLACQDG